MDALLCPVPPTHYWTAKISTSRYLVIECAWAILQRFERFGGVKTNSKVRDLDFFEMIEVRENSALGVILRMIVVSLFAYSFQVS